MTARWAFAPVCGPDFARVIVISPEVLIFLFFMITDPKTVPTGRVGRIVFAFLVGVASTLLMAPQTDEFGTKVGLLAGLVVLCAVRPLLDRLLPEPRSAADDIGRRSRPAWRRGGVAGAGLVRGALSESGSSPSRCSSSGSGSSQPARRPGASSCRTPATSSTGCPTTSIRRRFPVDLGRPGRVATGTTRSPAPGAQEILLTLAENLEIENQALLRHDPTILVAVDHGDRLIEMQGRLQAAMTSGTTTIARYRIDAATVALLVPFGTQDRAEPRFRLPRDGRPGDLRRGRRPPGPADRRRSRRRSSCAARRVRAGSNVAVLPPRAGS